MIASSTLLGLACLITSTFAAALPVTTDLARGAEGKARNPDLVYVDNYSLANQILTDLFSVRTQQDTYDHEDYQQDDQDNNDNQNDDYENNDHEDSNAQCGIALRLDWLTVNKHGNIFKISNKQLIVFKVDDENYSYLPTTPYTLNSQDDSYIPLKDGYRGIKVNASWSNNADQDHTGLTYAHMSIEGDNKQYSMSFSEGFCTWSNKCIF